MEEDKIQNTVAHLFRNEYGKVVAILTNKFGTCYLEKVEDAVQDTFLKAMQIWGYQNIPKNPTAWLFKVANNAMIDKLRRSKKIDYSDQTYLFDQVISDQEVTATPEISDSQLKMIFACCHPSLSQEHQLVLSLKLIGGFSNKELAEALLKKEETVAKSFTRAKKKFREDIRLLRIPVQMGLQSRLFVVLRVIYLLFTEGYAVTSGSQVVKRDICYEALRLALLLEENTYCRHPNLNALIALMCFHAARFDARLNEEGDLVTLAHQDRSKYNRELIQIGLRYLENSGTDEKVPSNYHLEAAVSYYHSTAKTYGTTNWKRILRLYDLHVQRQFSPMVALNRVVPYHKVEGAQRALTELNRLQKMADYESIGLYYAIKAELLNELGQARESESSLHKAIALTDNKLMKSHLEKKLQRH